MATPINPNKTTSNGNATSLGAELMSRLQASTQGEAGQGAFNAWMERHAMSTQPRAAATPARPSASAERAAQAPGSEASATAARLVEQALQKSRQLALSANRKPEQVSGPQTQGGNVTQAKGKGGEKVADGDRDESAASDEEQDTHPTAVQDSAMVKELTPPPEVKTDDATAMMAWLASLTHADLAHGKKLPTHTDAQAGDGKQGDAAQAALSPALTAQDATPTAAKPEAGALTLDKLSLQPTATAALQAELAPVAFKEELAQHRDASVDALSGGLGLRAPTWQGADVRGVPHESANLQAPVGGDQFAQALSDQLNMWIQKLPDDGSMTAELHLNPADMGPIHVKISLDGADARVDFAAAAVETRQAIEASLPMLSTALEDVGLKLSGGDVSSQNQQQAFQQPASQSGSGPAGASGLSRQGRGDEGDAPVARAVAAPRPGRAGGLDLYA